jgi:catechol 2,3-dioxygenase-like lactoylglutathione lyase family enzyme
MSPGRSVGINHIALQVGDLDAALDLYGRLFSSSSRLGCAG